MTQMNISMKQKQIDIKKDIKNRLVVAKVGAGRGKDWSSRLAAAHIESRHSSCVQWEGEGGLALE